MHQTAGTDTGPRWELVAYVASSVLFAAAVVALFLPWEVRSEARTGLDLLLNHAGVFGIIIVGAPVVGLALGLRRTRRAAVARAILAAVGTASSGFYILLAFGLEGRAPDWMGGWVTFWALIGAFVTNVIAALAGRRSRTERGGTERPVLPRGPWS